MHFAEKAAVIEVPPSIQNLWYKDRAASVAQEQAAQASAQVSATPATTATDTADITAKSVTPLIVANDKVYDGTVAATLSNLEPGLDGRDVTGFERSKVFPRQRINLLGIDITHHDQRGVVGCVPLLIPVPEIADLQIFKIIHPADHR